MSTAELKLNGTTIISESGGTADLHNIGTVDTTGLKINGVDAITDSVNGISFNNSGIADDSISGDKIDGGTISNFSSTGITDSATSLNLDINDNSIWIPSGNLYLTSQARLHFYRFGHGTAYTYHHHKTNIKWDASTTGSQMFSVHFDGHEYGSSKPINTGLVWYTYATTSTSVSIGYYGSHACTAYQAGDGYLVMRIQFGSGYYAAYTLSQFTTNQGLWSLTVTDSTASSTANFY